MDRKTLESVAQYLQVKMRDCASFAENSPHEITRHDASAQRRAYETTLGYVEFELSSLPTPMSLTPIDEALSYHDIRKQLDEARAELSRIARLAQEAIR